MTDAAARALVESPLQLVTAVEAVAAGVVPARDVRVLARTDVPGLPAVAAELSRLGLPDGVVVSRDGRARPPATAARHVLVLGDAASGRSQAALLTSRRPDHVVVVDDGLATLHALRALADADGADGATLVRVGVAAGGARRRLADAAAGVLRGLAARGRLTVFTALELPADLGTALAATGARVVRDDLAWLASLPQTDRIAEPVVVVGSAMVADGLLRAGPYVRWVQEQAEQGSVRYLPHRRQTPEVLAALRATPGVAVDRAGLPVELRLAGLRAPQRVVSLPSTALALLPVVLAGSGVRVEPTVPPDAWWHPGVSREVRDHLVSVVAAARGDA